MIVGIGIDLVEIERIGRSLDKFGEKFAARILTDLEMTLMPENPKNRVAYLASRFAAKEAAVKALGTGFSQGIGCRDVEVTSPDTRKPELVFHDKALERSQDLGVARRHISLSHERSMATAIVILET